jgi:putative membrane protein
MKNQIFINNKYMKNTSIFPKILFVIYLIVFAIGAINPYARDVWFVENATVWVVLIPIIILYARGVRFSNFSYLLMAIFIILHTIGGHFTFERVPFDFVDGLLGSGRDNFDRVAHFTVGFYAFPIAEYLLTRGLVTKKWVAILFGLFAIMAVAAIYEIFEWLYAISSDPTAGIAVLGSQGDIWDAQKDMLCDTLGAVVAVITFNFFGHKNNK